jgi:hypothetical protein
MTQAHTAALQLVLSRVYQTSPKHCSPCYLFADGSGGGAAGGSFTQTYVLRSLLQPTLLTR